MEPCAAQHHRIEDSAAIVSYDFESEEKHKGFEFAGQNSTVVGIADEAKSFSRSDKSNHILIENNKELSSLWRDKDFSIEIWVQTTSDNREFQVIASNKEWNSGEVKDYTDNRYAGVSRISGLNKGWALVCQPDGNWAWNIGNGRAKGDEERVEKILDEQTGDELKEVAEMLKEMDRIRICISQDDVISILAIVIFKFKTIVVI